MRLLERLDELYRLGGGAGANRPGFSAAEQEAHDLVAGWMEEEGLEVEHDPAGNLLGRVRGVESRLPEVWTGSHLDSVPDGGRFDGPLGVAGGLEAVARLGPQRRTLAVVAFRDEERGCLGSRARSGRLRPGEKERFRAAGLDPAPGLLPGAYVELHIEQGPVLADVGAPLGLVTGIAGIARAEREFHGRAGHAGTVPMSSRDDALVAAAEYVLRVRDAAATIEGAVATVGRLAVEPGGTNVIPGAVRLTVDARAPDRARLDALVAALELEPSYLLDPAAMAAEPRAALREAIEERGLPLVELPSGAGHDAGILAAAGVPAAMLFVRSLNGGVSHSPDELSSEEDVALAVDVLADALARLSAR